MRIRERWPVEPKGRKKKKSWSGLREKVEKQEEGEKGPEGWGEERQKKEHGWKRTQVENSRSRSTHEHEKENYEDGFYEKPGLNVEHVPGARRRNQREVRRMSHDKKLRILGSNARAWGFIRR